MKTIQVSPQAPKQNKSKTLKRVDKRKDTKRDNKKFKRVKERYQKKKKKTYAGRVQDKSQRRSLKAKQDGKASIPANGPLTAPISSPNTHSTWKFKGTQDSRISFLLTNPKNKITRTPRKELTQENEESRVSQEWVDRTELGRGRPPENILRRPESTQRNRHKVLRIEY